MKCARNQGQAKEDHWRSKPIPNITKITQKSGRALGQGGACAIGGGLGEENFVTAVGGSSGRDFSGERLGKVGKNICNKLHGSKD